MSQKLQVSGNGLKDFFVDLRASRFTGEVVFYCPDAKKSVFVQQGEITHCSSLLLDDRLGDVIYREGRISLDLFVELAGKVRENVRFGDLLVENDIFNMVDLWDALNDQSRAILQSLVFYPILDFEMKDAEQIKTPDFGLRFRWDHAIDKALEEQRLLRRFERVARSSPTLTIDERNRNSANTDFYRDLLALIEQHGDFNVIVDEKSQLSKVYTVRALFQMYLMGIIIDSWDLFAQDLPKPAEKELQEVLGSSNRIYLMMEELVQERRLSGWDAAVKRAVRILEREFGAGVHIIPGQGFNLHHLHKILVFNSEFKLRATEALSHRWPLSVVALIQEGLHKALLFLLFEMSNNRALEEDSKRIHAELVSSRGSYFSRVAQAIS
ncbi:hypothetical protein EBU99_10890 [bacterium]|nr:hypothetical protein [bacterium]